jgi:hypothetical protein
MHLLLFKPKFDIPFAEPEMAPHLVRTKSPWPPSLVDGLRWNSEVLGDLGHREKPVGPTECSLSMGARLARDIAC